jgi:hypothetical protein
MISQSHGALLNTAPNRPRQGAKPPQPPPHPRGVFVIPTLSQITGPVPPPARPPQSATYPPFVSFSSGLRIERRQIQWYNRLEMNTKLVILLVCSILALSAVAVSAQSAVPGGTLYDGDLCGPWTGTGVEVDNCAVTFVAMDAALAYAAPVTLTVPSVVGVHLSADTAERFTAVLSDGANEYSCVTYPGWRGCPIWGVSGAPIPAGIYSFTILRGVHIATPWLPFRAYVPAVIGGRGVPTASPLATALYLEWSQAD